MRFDKPIYFQKITAGAYEPTTGNYAEDEITEEKRFASVTNSRTDTLQLVYGAIKQGSLTIRLQMPFTAPFDRIRIEDKTYKVDYSRQLYNKHIFIVSEVQ